MKDLINSLYWYCTDFCINAANLLGISYEAFNFYLFIIGFPAVTLILTGINIWKRSRPGRRKSQT